MLWSACATRCWSLILCLCSVSHNHVQACSVLCLFLSCSFLECWTCGLCCSHRERVEAACLPLNYWCSCFPFVMGCRRVKQLFKCYFTLFLSGQNHRYSQVTGDRVGVVDFRISWSLQFPNKLRLNAELGTKILHFINLWFPCLRR